MADNDSENLPFGTFRLENEKLKSLLEDRSPFVAVIAVRASDKETDIRVDRKKFNGSVSNDRVVVSHKEELTGNDGKIFEGWRIYNLDHLVLSGPLRAERDPDYVSTIDFKWGMDVNVQRRLGEIMRFIDRNTREGSLITKDGIDQVLGYLRDHYNDPDFVTSAHSFSLVDSS